jgi:hypothetical protein
MVHFIVGVIAASFIIFGIIGGLVLIFKKK